MTIKRIYTVWIYICVYIYIRGWQWVLINFSYVGIETASMSIVNRKIFRFTIPPLCSVVNT